MFGIRLRTSAPLVAFTHLGFLFGGWFGLAGLSLAQNQQPQQQPQLGVAVQLPTFGVTIDANGLLQVATVEDPTGRLRAEIRWGTNPPFQSGR